MKLLAAGLILIAGVAWAQWSPSDYPDCAGASDALRYSRTTGAFSCGQIEAGEGGGALPAGMIAAFNAACPSGWTELAAAQGRVIVGLPSGGTLAGTVGTALTNLENRTHAHTYSEVVNHTHTVTVTDPGHVHTQRYHAATTGGLSGPTTVPDTSSNTPTNYGVTTASATTGITAATANPAGGVAQGTTATKATGDVIPYIQLRLCEKD
jgi:hypothetical protein